jgi:hypothetical protein
MGEMIRSMFGVALGKFIDDDAKIGARDKRIYEDARSDCCGGIIRIVR